MWVSVGRVRCSSNTFQDRKYRGEGGGGRGRERENRCIVGCGGGHGGVEKMRDVRIAYWVDRKSAIVYKMLQGR